NVGYDNKDFFWSDMLHYRKTSLFGHCLWSVAEEWAAKSDEEAAVWSDRLKAYALGYMTHLATDTTGHPFVNEKCGGPFRTHWQRHHLIENHIDAKTYDDEHGMDANYNMFTESALHYRIAFGDDGGDGRPLPPYPPGDHSLRGLYVRKRHLDLDSEMPEELASLIFEAMERAYNTSAQAADHGPSRTSPDIIPGGDGRPEIGTIQETYLTLFRYLKLSTLDGFSNEKPPPPEVFPNLDFPQLTDPHDDAPGEGDDDMSFWDWVLAILRFILWIAAVAIWLATILPAIVLDLGTYGPRLLAYYTIELPLFFMIKAERSLMVMTGYFHPMQDEIDLGLIQIGNSNHGSFLQLLADVDDILGTGLEVGGPVAEPVPDRAFPHQTKFESGGLLNTVLNQSSEEYHHPWDYPKTPVEICPTFAGPWKMGDLPHLLLESHVPANENLIAKYTSAPTPFETDMISFNEISPARHMGDPVNFSSFLMWQLARPEIGNVADWNLDADRGYGYKCWDWNRHLDEMGAGNLLTDTEGHSYRAPCTPPPQSKAMPYDPKAPLKIHYLDGDRKDPGCDVEVRCATRKGRGQKAGADSAAGKKRARAGKGGRKS
ncbi:MAG TPA: zinc dependent phospholipase C family protein, partial [Candidatus Manganitrophaceae bacterium]|nr:zinc dependent phospholipase C family protein [Candidatus Manganitrophaceae bacterium]